MDQLVISQRIESSETEIQIMQMPPIFSALKKGGIAAHKLARKNAPIDLDPRRVSLYSWKAGGLTTTIDGLRQVIMEIECGRGFYVRSLVHDLGELLGCGAYLTDLRRMKVGDFVINESVDLEEFILYGSNNSVEKLILPIDKILESWPAVILCDSDVRALGYGQSIILSPYRRYVSTFFDADLLRAYDPAGKLVAILERDFGVGLWKSFKYLGR